MSKKVFEWFKFLQVRAIGQPRLHPDLFTGQIFFSTILQEDIWIYFLEKFMQYTTILMPFYNSKKVGRFSFFVGRFFSFNLYNFNSYNLHVFSLSKKIIRWVEIRWVELLYESKLDEMKLGEMALYESKLDEMLLSHKWRKYIRTSLSNLMIF